MIYVASQHKRPCVYFTPASEKSGVRVEGGAPGVNHIVFWMWLADAPGDRFNVARG